MTSKNIALIGTLDIECFMINFSSSNGRFMFISIRLQGSQGPVGDAGSVGNQGQTVRKRKLSEIT